MYHSCGCFDVKGTEKHLRMVEFHNTYMFFTLFCYHLLQLVLWNVILCSRAWNLQFLPLNTSTLQLHVRLTTCIRVLNIWSVIRSRIWDMIRMSFNSERSQISTDTESVCRIIAGFQQFNDSSEAHCVTHRPRDLNRVWYLNITRGSKRVGLESD